MIKKSASITLQYDSCFSPFYANEFDKGIEWVRNCGFEGVELIICKPKEVKINKLNAMLERLNLKVSTIATGQAAVLEGISLTEDDESLRAEAVKRIHEHIDLSVEIGYPNVTIGLIRGKGDILKIKNKLKLLKQEILKCIEYAYTKGVMINLEPINRYEVLLLNSCLETYNFIMEIGNPECVGILFDTFHSNIEDADFFDSIIKMKGMISHVHFADSNRHLPGSGHIDFVGIIKTLEESSYNGYVSLEVLNLPNRETVIKEAATSLKKLFG